MATAINIPSEPPTRQGSPGSKRTPVEFSIRDRRPDDMPALIDLLTRQQPISKYPIEWPLSWAIEDFIQRRGELSAFVAVTPAGQVIGHVSICRCLENSEEEVLGIEWAKAHRCNFDDLRIIGVLFADPDFAGQGVGSALFSKATEEAWKDGGKPCLDCLSTNTGPLAFYQRRGWRIVYEWKDCSWVKGMKLLVYLLILDEQDKKVEESG